MIFDRATPKVDLNFLGTALVLAIIGCLLVYSATYYGDPGLGTLKKQILWVAIGLASTTTCSSTSPRSSTASASSCCCI